MIIAVLLTSCTQGQPPTTPTFAPTATPVPSATATLTPIPTVTNTPTEVPMPANEYQVMDANGNTLIVVNDQLFKWENGKQTPIEIENVVFKNAIDASNAARAIAPDAYFDVEGGQQTLRDILLPNGVEINKKFEMAVNNLIPGYLYGVPVSITQVDAGNGDIALIANLAVVGSDIPVPLVMGNVVGGKPLIFDENWVARIGFNVDFGSKDIKFINPAVKIESIQDLIGAIVGRPLRVNIVDIRHGWESNPYLAGPASLDFYNKIVKKYYEIYDQVVAANELNTDGSFIYGVFIKRIMDAFKNKDFDGFFPVSFFARIEK